MNLPKQIKEYSVVKTITIHPIIPTISVKIKDFFKLPHILKTQVPIKAPISPPKGLEPVIADSKKTISPLSELISSPFN